MFPFNFHHHNSLDSTGIYNLNFGELPPEVLFSAGIHPEDVKENLNEEFEWLNKVASDKNCVALGECGLDARFPKTLQFQKETFRRQISLASDLEKPMIIHCVNQFPDIIQLKKLSKTPVIIHGFNKRKTIGDELLRHGFHLSFGKSILSNVNLQDFFSQIPLDKIFLETDAADISIQEIYQKAAALRNLETEELTEIIEQNLHSINIL